MIGVLVVELDRCMSIQLDTDSKRILQRVYSPCQEGMLDSPERTKNQCLADMFLPDNSLNRWLQHENKCIQLDTSSNWRTQSSDHNYQQGITDKLRMIWHLRLVDTCQMDTLDCHRKPSGGNSDLQGMASIGHSTW